MQFLWPIKVTLRRRFAQLQLTTMEKDVAAYLDVDGARAFNVQREIDNEDILELFRAFMRQRTVMTPLDINAGVKHLWANDVIDAPRTTFKKARSTSSESMDGEFFVKRDEPEIYDLAIAAPLLRTVFTPIDEDGEWPEMLMVDCSNGEVGFSRYGNNGQAVDHVIREILRHN